MIRLLLVVASVLLPACGGGGGFPVDASDPPPPPKGKFSLAWTVTDVADQTIPCAQVGANFVTVSLRNRDVQGGSTEVFSCASLMATSLLSFTPGIYDLAFELSGTAGLLATAPAAKGIEIKANETTAVDPITFVVDATGKLALTLETGVANGNCGGGAGIATTTITLEHTGAACEPVTFDISGGGTYTVNCTTPQVAGCIDHDKTLSVATLPSGSYRISVKGTVNANDCWTTTPTLIVPPLGNTLTQTLNLTHQTTGC